MCNNSNFEQPAHKSLNSLTTVLIPLSLTISRVPGWLQQATLLASFTLPDFSSPRHSHPPPWLLESPYTNNGPMYNSIPDSFAVPRLVANEHVHPPPSIRTHPHPTLCDIALLSSVQPSISVQPQTLESPWTVLSSLPNIQCNTKSCPFYF